MGRVVRSRCAKSLPIPDGEPDEIQWRNHDGDGVEKSRPQHNEIVTVFDTNHGPGLSHDDDDDDYSFSLNRAVSGQLLEHTYHLEPRDMVYKAYQCLMSSANHHPQPTRSGYSGEVPNKPSASPTVPQTVGVPIVLAKFCLAR